MAKKNKIPCQNIPCDKMEKAKGLCSACLSYVERTGRMRSIHLIKDYQDKRELQVARGELEPANVPE